MTLVSGQEDTAAPRGLRVDGLVVEEADHARTSSLDLEVEPGRRVALVSTRGSEASAVLGALAGRRPLAAGTVTLDGEPLTAASATRQVGYVRADRNLVGTLTAVENLVAVLLADTRRTPAALWQRAEHQLAEVGLAPATWHNLAEQLSGGQQQRVALARALVARPRLLVLDDPTSELDPDTAELVVQVLDRASARGTVCVLTSSDEVLLASCDVHVHLDRV
jgi:ABC-type multidrug transport system ATPase subunit